MSAFRIMLRFVYGNRILYEKAGAHSLFSYPEFRLTMVLNLLRKANIDVNSV